VSATATNSHSSDRRHEVSVCGADGDHVSPSAGLPRRRVPSSRATAPGSGSVSRRARVWRCCPVATIAIPGYWAVFRPAAGVTIALTLKGCTSMPRYARRRWMKSFRGTPARRSPCRLGRDDRRREDCVRRGARTARAICKQCSKKDVSPKSGTRSGNIKDFARA